MDDPLDTNALQQPLWKRVFILNFNATSATDNHIFQLQQQIINAETSKIIILTTIKSNEIPYVRTGSQCPLWNCLSIIPYRGSVLCIGELIPLGKIPTVFIIEI